jgi:RNA polymerase sigma factor (sigma-70 family)
LDITDQELIRGCHDGSPEFQRLLYKRFAGKMLFVCCRYTNTREEAEDILQEGFLTVFTKLSQFKGEGSLEGWVRRIMVNKSIEHYRKASKIFTLVDIENVKDELIDADDVLSNISANELLEMIQSLPPMYKMVFNLYIFEDMNHKEIAERLGIVEGTSKSNLFHARMLLRKKLNHSMVAAKNNEYREQQV